MAEGWIMLHRSIFDNSLYFSEKFTRSQAWIDLLLLANHKESSYYVRNVMVTVKRGQISVSSTFLAKRWKWSRTKVFNFLDNLEKFDQISQHKTNVITTVSILKYDEYQSAGNNSNYITSDTKNGSGLDSKKNARNAQEKRKRDTKETQKNTYNNDNNDNNDNNVNNPPGYWKNSEIDFCNIRFDLWKKDTSKFINSVRDVIGPDVRLMDFNVEVNTLKDPDSKTIIKDPEAFFKSKIINLLTEHQK